MNSTTMIKMEKQRKMEKVLAKVGLGLGLLLLMISSSSSSYAAVAVAVADGAKTWTVEAACNGTTFPDVCKSALWPFRECLSAVQDPGRQMVKDVVAMALADARLLSSWAGQVSRMDGIDSSDKPPMADCAELLDNARALIHDSLATLKHLRLRPGDSAQLSDVRTWLSGALTDYGTCVDGFQEANRTQSFVFVLLHMHAGRSSALVSVSLALLNRYSSPSYLPHLSM